VSAAIDPAPLQVALDWWISARAARAAPPIGMMPDGRAAAQRIPRQVLAFDGKVLRGSRTAVGQVMLVAAYDQAAGVVAGQVAVDGGEEIAALPAELDIVADLQGVLITADALQCQRAHAAYLAGRGRATR
jgi:hypothetical protein